MKTCADFAGQCCESCHTDADEFGYDMSEIYEAGGALFAIVCCGKTEAALAARDNSSEAASNGGKPVEFVRNGESATQRVLTPATSTSPNGSTKRLESSQPEHGEHLK